MNCNLFKVVVVIIVLSVPAPTFAQSQEDNPAPREMIEGATKMMLQALELMLNAIPQYESPEILKNGDIIIRQKLQEPEQPPPEKDTKVDGEST